MRLPAQRRGSTAIRGLLAVAAATLLAACAGGSAEPGPTTLAVTGTNGLQFEPDQLTATAGTVTIELTAQAEVEHTLVIEELDDREVVTAAAGETASGTVDLEPGTYTFYCSVPAHRPAGMEGTLTVTGG